MIPEAGLKSGRLNPLAKSRNKFTKTILRRCRALSNVANSYGEDVSCAPSDPGTIICTKVETTAITQVTKM
jgi:hypothetical protein